MNRKLAGVLLVVACLGGPILSFAELVRDLPDAVRIAQSVDRTEQQLAASSGQDVVVRDPAAARAIGITGDPAHWANRGIAGYYGLRSLRGAQPVEDLLVHPAKRSR